MAMLLELLLSVQAPAKKQGHQMVKLLERQLQV